MTHTAQGEARGTIAQLRAEGLEVGVVHREASVRPGRRLVRHDGVAFIDFSTASYLGLSFDERLRKAVHEAIDAHGVFAYASPIFNRPPMQRELEATLAALVGMDDAIVFPSATMAHLGVLPWLCRGRPAVLVDERAHQTIFDALRVNARRRVQKYATGDAEALRDNLGKGAGRRGQPLVITDGIFSMSGRAAPMNALANLADEFDAALYIDDSHGFGACGERGVGMTGEVDRRKDVLLVGSLSKSLAAPLSFLAGPDEIVHQLRHVAHTCLFSINVAPSVLAAAKAALAISASPEGDALRERLAANRTRLANGLSGLGLNMLAGTSGVCSIETADESRFRALCLALESAHIAANPVTYPAIQRGAYRLRFCVSAAHSPADIASVIQACETAT